MAEKLTPQQEQAVYNRGGNLLVSAAAGSGKTKVLVDRLLTYLTQETEPANLDEFLIITYTKAAASELRGKIAAKLSERIALEPENKHLQKQMQRLFLTKISTVHGFCGDLLREYAYRLDIPVDFRVADENECRELRDTVMQELLDRAYAHSVQNENFRVFVDSQGLGRDDRLVPEIIEKVYDSARCHLNPEKWLEDCLHAADVTNVLDAGETVWGSYLMTDLKEYLSGQISILHRCEILLLKCEGMEKPALNIRQTRLQLEQLQNAKSWDEIVKNRSVDYGRLTFPRKNTDPELTERVKAARNACKKGLEKKLNGFTEESEQILRDLQQTAAGTQGLVQLVKEFERSYQVAKRSRRCMDFSDLEHKTLDLLLGKSRTNPSGISKEVGRRYREILVDEYQDSNGVQDAIFEVLTRERQNCFLVGDVKQSIYQFRLADPGIFLEKYRNYEDAASAQPGMGRKVLLSHNFRSGGEVIEAVNDVFQCCMSPKVGGLHYGEGEALREGIPHEKLPDAVALYAVDVQEHTYAEEAAFVAEKIKNMLQTGTPIRSGDDWKRVEPEDIVILLRSPGSAAGYFQQALEERGIRCTTGGGMDLLQTEEIGTLRSLLETIQNPRLDIPLISTLASPIFGFTADDLAHFRSQKKKGAVYDALLLSDMPKAKHFLSLLSKLRQEARMNTLTSLLEMCINLTRMDSIYGAMSGGESKSTNLQMFFQLAADFEKGNLRDLGQFLDHLTAMEDRGLVTLGNSKSGAVQIMSIHKSKGLEFPVVFLCNLSRKFNQESMRAQILCDKELGLGLSVADHGNRLRYPSIAKRAIAAKMTQESVSEELRVLYVAMTRARDRLIMTYASQYLQSDLQDISLRLDFDNGELLCREAICLGDWVLIAAMQRIEAGALHGLGGRPLHTKVTDSPWQICLAEAAAAGEGSISRKENTTQLPEGTVNTIKKSLSFQYQHVSATLAPSKQTATDRKGRIKDAEAAEHTTEPKHFSRTWRQPSFTANQIQGKTYGSAIHAAMQYLRYENCGSLEDIRKEIQWLVENRFLTQEQGSLIHCEKLAKFFLSDIGLKLRSGTPYLREFKFSILDQGTHYGEGLEGEQVLLQGVVDCALLEKDGITVVDFKTDNVTQETLGMVTERYRPQVETYAEALCRIYEQKIKAKYLYFFRLDRFVEI